MFRNYFLLNILLTVLVLFLGIRFYKTAIQRVDIPVRAAAAPPTEEYNSPDREVRSGNSSYDAIVSRNLFHPSRSFTKKTAKVAKPVSKKELPQLFGTIILNEKRLAILEDRSTKKSSLYEVNDSVSGFLLAQILENKVILQKNGETVEIKLRADKAFKKPRRIRRRPKSIGKRKKPRRTQRAARRRRPRRRAVSAGSRTR